jgi:redox-regulated HSP33 family molecular chaperone
VSGELVAGAAADDRGHLLPDDGATEAECAFCGEIHRFTAGELLPD